MAYTKVNWANGEAGGKKMNATNFGNMDNGIAANDSAIGNLSTLNTTAKDNLVDAINENVSKIGDLSTLNTTTKDNLVGTINELYNNSNFVIEKKGDYVYKKYDNGLVEIYQKSQKTVSITTDYNPSTARWCNVDCDLPEPIAELYSINTTIGQQSANSLLGWCYRYVPNTSGYKLFVYDLGTTRTSYTIYIYTTIIGRWKEEVVNNE